MGKSKPTPATSSSLDAYRAKRSAQRTPEPFGSQRSFRPRLYCVQKHAARRLHYDFRLEWGGTLWSWAVPKGPSPDPAVKRLAVHVEDHPVEYADFEGVIPAGNYGAGAVIVWDKGLWVPLDDPDEISRTGKLHFELRGYKLRGLWLLIRTRDKDWLLRKKPDAWATTAEPPFGEESVLSGLTLEELRDGSERAAAARAALEALGAPRRQVDAFDVALTLAESADAPFSSPEWIFELKYDGYRVLAARRGGEPLLRSRNGNDITTLFPEIARALRALPYEDLVLDGELVVLATDGRPAFQKLQGRAQLRRAHDIEQAAVEDPATLFAFDLLGFEGHDLRALPLLERKRILQPLLPRAGMLRYADHVAEHGGAMFEEVRKLGLEGILAKRADAPYVGQRTPLWLKIVVERTGDFVVCGFTSPRGSRSGFGALHLGVYENGDLVYAGRVGTGFSDETLRDMRAALDTLVQKDPPCGGAVPRGGENVWVRPEWVAEVRYKEVTGDGLLRAPVFVRLRTDKRPEECVREPAGAPAGPPEAPAIRAPAGGKRAAGRARRGASASGANAATASAGTTRRADASDAPTAPRAQPSQAGDAALEQAEAAMQRGEADTTAIPIRSRPREVRFSNLDKVFWPEDGTTKGDLIAYYRGVAGWLLPYLRDRPLVLTRYPDGIHGKSFYQKNAPEFVPEWIRRVQVWSESSEREIEYLVCDSEEALLYIANMGAIPLHIWPSRVETLQHPDWCILDLDPKEAPFVHVVTLAQAIRALCDEIELECFVKTTGSTGLHVLVPLGRLCTFDQSRILGQLISRLIEAEHPEISTTRRNPSARGGRVYLDFLQNRHGQLLVSPYSVRPLPGAPVSAPLEWSEVNRKLTPQQFTIRNLPQRLARRKSDPLRPLLDARPNLIAALETLAGRLESTS